MTKSTVSRSQGDPSVSAAAAPRSLADIPGLGPIRVRALTKAGLNSLIALRAANLDALASVPGLTKIKARQIHEYLQPFAPEDLIETPPKTIAAGEPDTEPSAAGRETAPGTSQVVQRATRAMGEVITVLLSPEAPQFRTRFLRILGLFAQCAESIATDATHLSDEQQAQAVRRLRRAVKSLSELTGVGAGDKKAQGRVSDAIEELTAKLAECRLSS